MTEISATVILAAETNLVGTSGLSDYIYAGPALTGPYYSLSTLQNDHPSTAIVHGSTA